MKKCQVELKNWRFELNAGGIEECRIFRYALRKFRKVYENFATIAKISQSLRNFALHSFSL